MSDHDAVLPEPERRKLFVALVAAQDEGLSVRESREQMARRFGVSEEVVVGVEEEGLEGRWPPLGRG
jgi:hypothetical protein